RGGNWTRRRGRASAPAHRPSAPPPGIGSAGRRRPSAAPRNTHDDPRNVLLWLGPRWRSTNISLRATSVPAALLTSRPLVTDSHFTHLLQVSGGATRATTLNLLFP